MTRPDRKPRRRPEPSDPETRPSLRLVRDPADPPAAQPASRLSVQQENFFPLARELPPLFERHWRELGTDQDAVPLAPDWDTYFGLAAANRLHVTTARCGDALAGYIFNLVGPHLHYATTLHAEIEMFWLDPIYRGAENGWFAVRFFRENEAYLRAGGVKRVFVGEKLDFMNGRVGLIFRRLGYRPIDMHWGKVI